MKLPQRASPAFRLAISLALLPALAHAQNPIFVRSWPVQGHPLGLAIGAGGNVLLCNAPNATPPIFRYSPDGTLLSQMGVPSIYDTYGVAATSGGDIFYANYSVSRMFHMSSTGADLGGWGRSDCCFIFIAFDNLGACPGRLPCTHVYVTDPINNLVFKYTSSAVYGDSYVMDWSSHNPTGIAFWGGAVYVTSIGGIVSKYSTTGTLLGSFVTGATHAEELAAGPDGHLYLADWGTSRLLIFSTDGTPLGSIGASVAGYAYGPVQYFGVAVAGDGTIFAGDYNHSRVLKFAPSATPSKGLTWGSVKSHYR